MSELGAAAASSGVAVGLLAVVRHSTGEALPRHAAALVCADPARTESAIELLTLAILRRLARRSAGPEGAARVFDLLGSADIDDDVLAATARLLGDGPAFVDEPRSAGEQYSHDLFGRWTASIVFQVSSTVGLPKAAVSQLLDLITPFVYASLRDHVRQRGLDAEGLHQRLKSEFLTGAFAPRRPLLRAVAAATRRTVRSGRAALVRGTERLMRRDRRALVRDGVLVGALAAVVTIASLAGADRTDLSPGAAVEVGRDGARDAAIDELRAFLAGDAAEVEFVFALDGVRFEPASATLKSESNVQLERLARALAEFPEARITIEALVSGAEPALGERRALAVRAALAALGIRPSRMVHVGGSGDTTRPGPSVEARVTKGKPG